MFRLMKMLRGRDLALTFVSLFLTVLQVACDVAQPFLLSDLLDTIQNSGNQTFDLKEIWTFGGIMIALAIVSFGLGSISTFTTARVSVRLGSKIRSALFQKVQSLTFVEIDKFTTASLITRITNDVMNFQNTLVMMLRILLRSSLIFTGGIIASFAYSAKLESNNGQNLWWLAFIILGCLFAMLLVMSGLIYFAIPYFKRQQKDLDKTNEIMRENLLGIRVVKAFNLQHEQIGLFDVQNNKLRGTFYHSKRN